MGVGIKLTTGVLTTATGRLTTYYGCTHYGRLRDHAELLSHEPLQQGDLLAEELCEAPHRVVLVVEVAHLGGSSFYLVAQ